MSAQTTDQARITLNAYGPACGCAGPKWNSLFLGSVAADVATHTGRTVLIVHRRV